MTSEDHDWVMLATFMVPKEKVAELASAKVENKGMVGMELSQEMMRTLDGPGCSRCSLEWTAGWGQPCSGVPEIPQ